jgi:hypothetical protein
MRSETFEAIDLTELAELIEDEDGDSDEPEPAAPSVRATTAVADNAVA